MTRFFSEATSVDYSDLRRATERRGSWRAPVILLSSALVIAAARIAFGPLLVLDGRAQAWATITIAICFQALPFLVLGVIVSAFVSAFLPGTFLRRIVPRSEVLAVPVVATAGMLLPGCECGSVPVSAALMRRGVPDSAALAFLLASPAINPVVLVSTAVAYSATPSMALARFFSSLLASVLVGWAWIGWRRQRAGRVCPEHEHHGATRLDVFRASAIHDLMNAGGYLVLGGMIAAAIKAFVPSVWFDAVTGAPVAVVLIMAALAVFLSLCSEADAFVAASFTQFSPTAQLVFLTVGPMIDLKLVAMQYGAWGGRFVVRFVPLVLVSAIGAACLVGFVLNGGL